MRSLLSAVSALAVLSACSSITSQPIARGSRVDGLVYYLPKKALKVTVTSADRQITGIQLDTTSAFADLSAGYALRFNPHLLAKNKLEVDVNDAGLLTSAKANTSGDVAAAFRDLGTLAGTFAGSVYLVEARRDGQVAKAAAGAAEPDCLGQGPFVFIIEGTPAETGTLVCDGNVVVTSTPLPGKVEATGGESAGVPGQEYSGVFYRMNRPLLVKAGLSDALAGQGSHKPVLAAAILNVPDESEVKFLPVARSLFTASDAQITLNDGVPTKFVQQTDGELAALLKIPANILLAYFDAVAAVFGKSSAQSQAEAAALANNMKLEIAKQKYQSCLETMRAGNEALFDRLKCNQP